MSDKSLKSIGIIMDGNRRWAKEQGITVLEGHTAGYERLKEVLTWCQESGIQELTVYAFSTENWQREEKEISHIMGLFRVAFTTWLKDIQKEEVKVRFIGDRAALPSDIQEYIMTMESETKDFTKGTLVIALSYGGRAEILAAVNALLDKGMETATEEEFKNEMWSAGLGDPDLIIRTGGDTRLSNFLTWQSAYSELFFTDTKWPAFSKEEFENILSEFSSRERRLGK